MRTRVKICGITNIEDAMAAIDAGADALGFNMYKKSPRYIEVGVAKKLMQALPPFMTSVGLFVNEEAALIEEIDRELNFNLLQFHGDEDDGFCRQFSKPFIKAVRTNRISEVAVLAEQFPSSVGILVDKLVKGTYGGTGEMLEWDAEASLTKPLILAGGLNPNNVGEAIEKVRPFAVDVSNGVEATQIKKDINKIQDFMIAVTAGTKVKSG